MSVHGAATMPDLPPSGARTSPATARNRAPILEVLRSRLPASGLVLEIAAGAGEHAVYNAAALPNLQWLPTDLDFEALESIAAWRADTGLANLLPARRLDAADPGSWPVNRADAVISINMVHISPWTATEGLMAGAGRVLPPQGCLFLYGPFFESDVQTEPSNREFDEALRRRNPEWGIRRLEAVTAAAAAQGLVLSERISMPANNLTVVFRKT